MREHADSGQLDDDVGSLAEETWRLIAALGMQEKSSEDSCPHGWCPVCRLADMIQDHPELREEVTEAAMRLGAAVMDLVKVVSEATKRD